MNRKVRIQETDRIVEIKSPEDVLKYQVILSKTQRIGQDGNEVQTDYVYIVDVKSFFDNPEGEVLQSLTFDTLDEANQKFARCVKNYTLIVKAQFRPVDDIRVYADKIGYRILDQDCCLNCKFCHIDGRFHGMEHLVCTNKDNFSIFKDLVAPGGCHDCMRHRRNNECIGFDPSWIPSEIGHVGYSMGDGCFRPGPHRHHGSFAELDVRPRVDFNGICENYKRREPRH